jgi:dihydroorotate dehydrogenase
VDAVIISNTTLSRPTLRSRQAGEQGGLSGKPLFQLSTRQLARFHQSEWRPGAADRCQAAFPMRETAWAKGLEAGASLIQLYSALVYQGPELVDGHSRRPRRKTARTPPDQSPRPWA